MKKSPPCYNIITIILAVIAVLIMLNTRGII